MSSLFRRVTDAVVTEFPGVTIDELIGPSRQPRLVVPRHTSMWLIREFGKDWPLRYSFPAIGRMFNRDHASIIHALAAVRMRINQSPSFAALCLRLLAKVDDASQPSILCRFSEGNPLHTEPAVFHVRLDQGCVCFPDDREQWLCWQHFHDCASIGGIEVVKDLMVNHPPNPSTNSRD